ncbi:MAG: hypothetical protein AABZ19_14260 [Pseudomonadota bacterium]
MNVTGLYNEFETTYNQWLNLVDRLHQGSHNMDMPRSILRGMSTSDLKLRISVISELLLSIQPSKASDMAFVLLNPRAVELRQVVQQMSGFISHALLVLVTHWQPEVKLIDANDSYALTLERSGSPIITVDLSEQFRQIAELSASLLSAISQVVPLCKTAGVADFSDRLHALNQKTTEVEALKVRAEACLTHSDQAHLRASEVEAEIRQLNTQASEQITRIREMVNQASADSGHVTAMAEQVRAIVASADALNQLVTGYQPKFEAFQRSLDTRNDEFDSFSKNVNAATAANSDREATISRLIDQSNGMLAGATTAGLGVMLEETRNRYEDRMKGARNGFFLAVALLLISALPLAAHLIPNLFGSWVPALDPNVDGSSFSVIGKVLLLLPATWLTAFFTQTYANLFQLEREYAHKAALAGSVHGFKLQAPKYEEEITAEVFMEIRMNPAHGPSVQAASHPLYDVLAKVVSKVLDKTKGESKDEKG